MSIEGTRNDIIAKLLALRHELGDADEVQYAMISDIIKFTMSWGARRQTAPPLGAQFVQFTVNGQPVDPSQFMNMGQPNGQDINNNSDI